ncbi:HET-domain-containing protein, partial [Stipitochalara longipes BDJ]
MVPYKPLAAVAEIRLLHLHPGSDDEPITCHFEHVNTLHHPQFEALSYMWGSKDSTKAIKVNGAIFDIRENLWQALKHVRLANWVRVLWIDALCINQDDINERNNQVSQMGNIYARSKGVVAWLGLSDDSSRAAMDFFIRFKPGLPETRYSNGLHETRPLVIDAKTISAISLFCDKEYWTRLWIIQEVVVS